VTTDIEIVLVTESWLTSSDAVKSTQLT